MTTLLQTTQAVDPGAGWTPANVAAVLGAVVTLFTAIGSIIVALTALFHALKAGAGVSANNARIGNTEQSVRSVAERVNEVALATPPPAPTPPPSSFAGPPPTGLVGGNLAPEPTAGDVAWVRAQALQDAPKGTNLR